ncbi:MAG TPA: sugar-transfer associated ATP-grasp domain-containing protein [Clostridia bacterium]|nr:sugar-transfer associated ATP-grasp domain-containing protein [Clostridia bacterium]HRX43474.1 sugar-transfer associated ATP-grasp domain-containing protein [Clostridia bacterium]
MKDLLKKLVTGSIRMARNLFYRHFYRKQIKKEFLLSTDTLPEDYREDIRKYWRRAAGVRVSTDWHRWYTSRNGIRDVRYIPEDLYYCRIEPALNKEQFSVPLSDKSIFDLLMPDFKRPHTITRNVNGIFTDSGYGLMTREQAVEACKVQGEIVIKPTIDSGGGRRVLFFTPGKGDGATVVIEKMFNEYGRDFIIQESVRQHPDLARLNAGSVNTLRILSFLNEDSVVILSTIIRAGLNGCRVDNIVGGGHSLGVDKNGCFRELGFTKYGEIVTELPNGLKFNGMRVPGYSNAVEIVKTAHSKLSQFRLISWDIAIDPDEIPVLIEYNTFYQAINFHQLGNGPLFGDLTDDVLGFVFGKK